MFELMVLSPILGPMLIIGGIELLHSAIDWAEMHPVRFPCKKKGL